MSLISLRVLPYIMKKQDNEIVLFAFFKNNNEILIVRTKLV